MKVQPKVSLRRKSGGKFLKGPVSLDWLATAGQLPGKSLHVGIVLWFLAGVCRTRTVALPNRVLSLFGVDRHAKYRALNYLEQAGLVKCERHTGRCPRVTILDGGKDK
jgi:hypothetical protein